MTVPTYRIDHLPMPAEQFGAYRKTATTPAIRIRGPFQCVTSEGNLAECPDGWLALDAHGYPYPINAQEFAAIYEPADDEGDRAGELGHLRTFETTVRQAMQVPNPASIIVDLVVAVGALDRARGGEPR